MKLSLDIRFPTVWRWVIALALLWAGVAKLANVQGYHASLLAGQLPVPEGVLALTAVSLPWLELLCGLMLVARFRIEVALAWALVLLSLALVVAGQAWLRGSGLSGPAYDLQWLGPKAGPAWPTGALFHALVLLRTAVLLTGTIYLWRRREESADRESYRTEERSTLG